MPRSPFEIHDIQEDRGWESQAKCKGLTPSLFEYTEKESPAAHKMSFKSRLAFNAQNFLLAEEVCIECPVMFQCLSTATAEDKYWTVRGGEPPGRFEEESIRFEKGMSDGTIGNARTCQNGHFLPEGGRCKTCAQARQRALRARKRDAVR